MTNLTVVTLLCSLLITYSGCLTSRSNDLSPASHEEEHPARSNIAVLHPAKKQLRPYLVKLHSSDELKVIDFLDDSHGWVASDRELYYTEDVGQHWSRVPLDVPKQAAITNISFVDSLHGWMLLTSSPSGGSNYEDYRFWLMGTNDSGKSWNLQHEGSATDVIALAFADEKNGWIAGTKYTGISPLRFEPFLIQTSDGGLHWSDLSATLKQVLGDERDDSGFPPNEGIIGLLLETPSRPTVITSRNKLVKTDDVGSKWNHLEVIPNDFEHAAMRAFAMTATGRIWLAKARDSEEGMTGLLKVEQSDNSWLSFILPGVYFADASNLKGDSDFLACGYRKKYTESANIVQAQKEASILHSSDGGKNWTIVYTNPEIQSVNSLFHLRSGTVWAVGSKGTILRFDLTINNDLPNE